MRTNLCIEMCNTQDVFYEFTIMSNVNNKTVQLWLLA